MILDRSKRIIIEKKDYFSSITKKEIKCFDWWILTWISFVICLHSTWPQCMGDYQDVLMFLQEEVDVCIIYHTKTSSNQNSFFFTDYKAH